MRYQMKMPYDFDDTYQEPANHQVNHHERNQSKPR